MKSSQEQGKNVHETTIQSITKGEGLSQASTKRFLMNTLLSPGKKISVPELISIPDTSQIARYQIKRP